MIWKLKSEQEVTTIDELRWVLLKNRSITDEATFFHPLSPETVSLSEVGLDEKQMVSVVARIQKAKEKNEDVLIFGDYDADGICATAILWEGLRAFGIVARPFIPHREKHGYGLSLRSLDAVLAEKKPDLLITVDNGIVAHDAFAKLKELGIDAVLTDHHLPEEKLPPAFAILHSPQLCGSTVAWFLARELSKEAAQRSLDIAAVATVTDQMPLLGINRSFVTYGLKELAKTRRVGLRFLFEKAGIDPKTVNTGTINYAVGPRINAMGRLKHGMPALRLLCTKSEERARELVTELNDTNSQRQELTTVMIDHALQTAAQWQDEHIIIVASDEYHEGVIGLIAGKLAERFSKPAIAIAVHGTTAKASARSVSSVNIVELIREVRDDLLELGGHPQAAGFGLLPEKIEEVKQKLQTIAKEKISNEMLQPQLKIECEVAADLIDENTISMINTFAPFGVGNPTPLFSLRNMEVVAADVIGQASNHLKLKLRSGENTFTALGWNMGERVTELKPKMFIDVAGALELNEWKGRRSCQILLKDIQQAP